MADSNNKLNSMDRPTQIVKTISGTNTNTNKKLQIYWASLGHKRAQIRQDSEKFPYCHSCETLEHFLTCKKHDDSSNWKTFHKILKEINTIPPIISTLKQILIEKTSVIRNIPSFFHRKTSCINITNMTITPINDNRQKIPAIRERTSDSNEDSQHQSPTNNPPLIRNLTIEKRINEDLELAIT